MIAVTLLANIFKSGRLFGRHYPDLGINSLELSKIKSTSDINQFFPPYTMLALEYKIFTMNKTIATPEIIDIMDAGHYAPAISIIMPFDPKMTGKSEIYLRLKNATDYIENELLANYSSELVTMMLQKLKAVLGKLNYTTHKKSLAIYLSPVFEKVLYLDVPVEEKIMVDESFEIRDLIRAKKQSRQFLLLMISGQDSKIFLGDGKTLVRIQSASPASVIASWHDAPERVANFNDITQRKEIMLEKFLHQVDNVLSLILQAYQLPLLVIGSKRVVGHFNKITKHKKSIIETIYGSYDSANCMELNQILRPYLCDWRKLTETALLHRIDEAAGNHRLVCGVENVWKEAIQHKGSLLVVEENYMYQGFPGNKEDVIYQAIVPFCKYSYIKDAVDDIIEKVLEDGGDVEFVEEGVLEEHGRIALVKFF